MGEGRGGKHHLLAIIKIGAQLLVEKPAAAYVALQNEALRSVSVDLLAIAGESANAGRS